MGFSLPRIYSLSLALAKDNGDPKIIFKVSKEISLRFEVALAQIKHRMEQQAVAYLRQPDAHFALFDDLIDSARFGYGICGERSFVGDGMVYAIRFAGAKQLPNTALTLMLVFMVFSYIEAEDYKDSDDSAPSHPEQLMSIELYVSPGGQHSHPLGGYFSPAFGAWLAQQASVAKSVVGLSPYDTYTFPDHSIEEVMKVVWALLVPNNAKGETEGCKVFITGTGRISLRCPGDACDVSIYPEGGELDGTSPVRFDCHNLDAACQQITLLCGLAALHDLAVRHLG